MENFGLLKFLKSPYPAGRETPPKPPPGNALKNPSGNALKNPLGNGEKTPENTEKNVEKNVENKVKNAGNTIKNGEIYLDFMEKQRNLSNKIGKK